LQNKIASNPTEHAVDGILLLFFVQAGQMKNVLLKGAGLSATTYN
jgi:hypothetical protein